MNLILLVEIIYVILMFLVIFRVLYDTRSGSKALAYILFIVMIPVLGMLFYFWFGVNYRKRKLYSKKIDQDKKLREELRDRMFTYSSRVLNSGLIPVKHRNLVEFIRQTSSSPLTANNAIKLLLNGEEKFPELLNALEAAKSHIHLEYYIYENDKTGNEIANVLIKKALEGVEVRFLYDDFGSHGLGTQFLKRLEDAGVETAPFYKIKWYALASRLNYRNHRKIIIIDGETSFIGGINISDKYRNDIKAENGLFWRDTHLMINGIATLYLQYLFLCDWNFCSDNKLEYNEIYFPPPNKDVLIQQKLVQIAPSGPDSTLPVIFYSLMQAIGSAKERILITSPYFIPGDSLMDALIIAAKSGVEVILLVPGESDSKMVDAAARSYYTELLQHDVRIFLYNKGFVHAKTLVIDRELSIIGSANMDYRSFDLNFEVNAMLYSPSLTSELYQAFMGDLDHATEINANDWLNRSKVFHLWERAVRLLSPFL
ncbi:MAG: cardiolipin synthase [Arenibacter latericius]|nr:cardiolipin synthase [Arenibacter latericius]